MPKVSAMGFSHSLMLLTLYLDLRNRSWKAFFSTSVMSVGTETVISEFLSLAPRSDSKILKIIVCILSKSAITPLDMGNDTSIFSGAFSYIEYASSP